MKVIIGTQIVPTTVFIILFVALGILLTSFPQFVYSQTVENDIIENTLETVEEATKGISEITNSLNNASELIERSTQNTTAVAVNDTDSSIGQEKEHLKPLSDEMLEYAEEKFGINLSLPRETNVQILNRLFDDPQVGLQSFKKLDDAIDSLDDNPYENQYDDSSTLEEQLKFTQEKLMQAEVASSNGIEYTESEWGIKINIQDPWKISSNSNNPNNLCENNDSSKCLIVLDNALVEKQSSMTILAEKGQDFKNECQCDSLLEFVQYDYTRMYDSLKDFFLIGDNQTIINGNVSAWQMEYDTINKNNIRSHLIMWAMSHDIFYKISYHAQKDIYSNDLHSVKEFINNIEFIVPRNESQSLTKDNLPSFMSINNTKEEKQKQPSFMSNSNQEEKEEKQKIQPTTTTTDSRENGEIKSSPTNDSWSTEEQEPSTADTGAAAAAPEDPNALSEIGEQIKSLFSDPAVEGEPQQQRQQQQSKKNTTSTHALYESNTLTILSHDSYINSIGHMHVIGEVENNTHNIKQFVQVIATFYDDNNKVVGTSNTYTTPTDLKPGETAPFDLMLTDASIPIEQIERYTLKVSEQ
jgi:hypothetical protein